MFIVTRGARRLAKVPPGGGPPFPPGVGPRFPQVVVLVGATGDLARRKLIPGMLHLAQAGFIPTCRIIGVSLDALDANGFRAFAKQAFDEFSKHKCSDAEWAAFAETLD